MSRVDPGTIDPGTLDGLNKLLPSYQLDEVNFAHFKMGDSQIMTTLKVAAYIFRFIGEWTLAVGGFFTVWAISSIALPITAVMAPGTLEMLREKKTALEEDKAMPRSGWLIEAFNLQRYICPGFYDQEIEAANRNVPKLMAAEKSRTQQANELLPSFHMKEMKHFDENDSRAMTALKCVTYTGRFILEWSVALVYLSAIWFLSPLLSPAFMVTVIPTGLKYYDKCKALESGNPMTARSKYVENFALQKFIDPTFNDNPSPRSTVVIEEIEDKQLTIEA